MTKSQEIPGSTTSGPGIENEEFPHFLPPKSSRAQVNNLVYKNAVATGVFRGKCAITLTG